MGLEKFCVKNDMSKNVFTPKILRLKKWGGKIFGVLKKLG